MRPLKFLAFGVILSGCVLHSTTPIFTDADATLALGTKPLSFAVYERDGDAWVPTSDLGGAVQIEGRHYIVIEPTGANEAPLKDAYYFIPLDPTHYAVQATVKGEADYAIATWNGTDLLVTSLDCVVLKTQTAARAVILFDGDDCTPRPNQTAPLTLFRALLPALSAPDLRFVRQ